MSIIRTFCAALSITAATCATPTLAGDNNLPPFDFSDAYYLANGINPATLIGRPTGSPPNSIIDNSENGPNFNNVRLLDHTAAFDHSGHPIFFSVTGLPTAGSFTNNAAGQRAREIADTYKVYEFPRAANPAFAVFPKRQDLIADLRNGYFSNDPLGVWQVNIVRFTPAATNTQQGRAMLAEIAGRNGQDLDGTPLIRTINEVEDLLDEGFVTIQIPAADGSQGFRWFFCPVLEDPRDGAIAPDAHLTRVDIPAEGEFDHLFDCLQQTGHENCDLPVCRVDFDGNGTVNTNDFFNFLAAFFASDNRADFNNNGSVNSQDFFEFLAGFFAGC